MSGKAASAAYNLPAFNNQRTGLADTLDQLEAKFMPPARSQIARAHFDVACQAKGEDLLTWHNHIEALFRKATPTRTPPG